MKSSSLRGMLAAAVVFPALGGVAWAGGGDDLGCSNATLNGDYAFSVLTIVAASPPGPGVVVGLGTFDGRGGFTQIDYPGNGGTDLNLDENFRTGQTGRSRPHSSLVSTSGRSPQIRTIDCSIDLADLTPLTLPQRGSLLLPACGERVG